MSTAIVAVQGVLRQGTKCIPEGRRLISALGQTYRVALALDDNEVDAFNHWLRLEHVLGHQEVLPGLLPATLRGQDARVAQIEHLRGRGEHVVLLVDSDPDRVAEAFKYGLLSLLFCDPGLMRPEFRPDYDAKPRRWDDLVAEIERQHYEQVSLSDE